MRAEDLLDRALRGEDAGRHASASIQALVEVASDVAQALAAERLSRADQERIYARSLAMLEAAVDEQRRGWRHALRGRRPAPPVLVGGAAAVTLGLAAIGWVLLHGRGTRGPVIA